MTNATRTERVSRRRQLLAAAQGLGWRFAGTRLLARRRELVPAPVPKAAWLLASDGRPALASFRRGH
jgi:hypothetical protein